MISFDDFKKVEITVGKILSAEKVADTDKLLKLRVGFGNNTNSEQGTKARTGTPSASEDLGTSLIKEDNTTAPDPSLEKEGKQDTPLNPPSKEGGGNVRQIISGIAMHFPDPQTLVGKKCMFVTNLEPRVIRGLESNGMLFAVSTEDGKFSLLEPSADIPEGTHAK